MKNKILKRLSYFMMIAIFVFTNCCLASEASNEISPKIEATQNHPIEKLKKL